MSNKMQIKSSKEGFVSFQQNVPLSPFTTLKIGGPADLFYEARSVEEFVAAIVKGRGMKAPVTILGGGSNILIADGGIRGLVVKNNTGAITIRGMKGTYQGGEAKGKVFVEADSGVVFNKLVRFTVEEGLGGLEAHLGLPGTVGGAIFMNSKWTKPEAYVGDAVYQVTILTPRNDIKVVDRSYFRFAYDASIIQKSGDIALRVVFALTPQNKEDLWKVANQSVAYRRESQPQGVKSPGCTFRNISKADAVAVATPGHTTSAGFLVDHAGLKGAAVGDAQISPIHANFIINNGRASARDVVELIERARAKVKKQFGVELEEEIVRLGEF
ncbi:UDP-N-acetylmuramate dehydrogenase [Candidatus Gottesmanbacteria bacterium]|nr:UDP-N-acetylmuramate dehydrogenase [Candidatus Gottesmanbacteria bacterium]